MNKTYFAYIRVSTVKQSERGSSLQEQRSAIEAYAARNNLVIASWYQEMETAAKQGRRQFAQMMAALVANKAHGVIIHKIDRSARNLRDWASLGDLIDGGVDVRFVTDNFDLLSRGGRLSADIQAVVAADFIRNLRDEVRKGMHGRLKQGLYPWKAPMGYLNTGKGNPKTIDPVKGPLVRRMFERYATKTVSLDALRLETYEWGLRTKAGKILPCNGVHLVLNNPFYMGLIRLRSGETYPGVHEPLITKALFDRVQAIMRGKTAPRTRKNVFLLRQMVKCDGCGRRTLTGELQKGIVYYRCHAHSCSRVSWRGDVLENFALDHIRRIRIGTGGRGDEGTRDDAADTDSAEIEDLRRIVDDACSEWQVDVQRLRTSLDLSLQHAERRIARLTDLLIDESIDRTTYNERKEQLLKDRQGALDELSEIHTRSPLTDLFDEFERNNNELLRYELMTGDEKRELLEIVCSNFSVCGKSSTFTLRTPYKEIAQLNDSTECAPNQYDVRTFGVFDILKRIADEATASGQVAHIAPQVTASDAGRSIPEFSSPRPLIPRSPAESEHGRA
jgi:site-specific DNA recombinase